MWETRTPTSSVPKKPIKSLAEYNQPQLHNQFVVHFAA
jgi:hypothetical protein